MHRLRSEIDANLEEVAYLTPGTAYIETIKNQAVGDNYLKIPQNKEISKGSFKNQTKMSYTENHQRKKRINFVSIKRATLRGRKLISG
jgi:hypothetical protein